VTARSRVVVALEEAAAALTDLEAVGRTVVRERRRSYVRISPGTEYPRATSRCTIHPNGSVNDSPTTSSRE
jgi:hypothetical protein